MTGEATTIYNSTDGPLPYDRAGRMVPARERLRVPSIEGYPAKGHVDAERFIVVAPQDDDPIAPALEDDDDAPEPAEQPAESTEDVVTEQPQTSAELEEGAEVSEVSTLEQPAQAAETTPTPRARKGRGGQQ